LVYAARVGFRSNHSDRSICNNYELYFSCRYRIIEFSAGCFALMHGDLCRCKSDCGSFDRQVFWVWGCKECIRHPLLFTDSHCRVFSESIITPDLLKSFYQKMRNVIFGRDYCILEMYSLSALWADRAKRIVVNPSLFVIHINVFVGVRYSIVATTNYCN